jgi:hypothetical protein
MKRRLIQSLFLTLCAAAVVVSAGCAVKTVNQIIADPSRYGNREVRVSGAVVDSYSVANRGAYLIDDGTGRLWVVSDKGVPAATARVTVKGTIRTGFNVGTLGDRMGLPAGLRAGLVMVETSHEAKR